LIQHPDNYFFNLLAITLITKDIKQHHLNTGPLKNLWLSGCQSATGLEVQGVKTW